MPVECPVALCAMGQERFHALDNTVMRLAFALHNTLGRLCDERIYQDELALRCGKAGIAGQREVELLACHQTFEKSYYLDLLLESGAVYELKTVESLASRHQNQLINYFLLTGTHHGKLINFRPTSVESRFVSTRLNHDDRTRFRIFDSEWHQCNDTERLESTLISLLEDWGTFLDIHLYREALLHLLDGPNTGLLPIAIQVQGRTVGFQKMCLLNPGHAWHLSSVRTNLLAHETHIKRLICHTSLNYIHWINLNQNQVTLKSIKNDFVLNDFVKIR